jgi:UDP-hydrolysing UDP-N-acetyl-D-glucosamine 2-epimerase
MVRNSLKKFLFFFDSRATFAYSNNVIKVFKKNKLKFEILVSGNYLEKNMKINNKIFKKHKLKIKYRENFKSPTDKIESWPMSFGDAMKGYAKILAKAKPDIVIITGDRIETLCFCITCSYMNIPIAHIQAGDKSGHIDDVARGLIAKLSHLHFAPSKQACLRLKKWGEKKERIFFTGAPQLDDMVNYKKKTKDYYVVIFHPILNEKNDVIKQVLELVKAIKYLGIKVKWIYPNNDLGFINILKIIKKYKDKNIKLIANFERNKFLETICNSKGMIGNSSSGIIEASMFNLPVLNIGKRQNGRPQSTNILNCDPQCKKIIKKINLIEKDKKFILKCEKSKNPYYVKNSSRLIYKILRNLRLNDSILQKY